MSNRNNLPDIPVDWILDKQIDPLLKAADGMPEGMFKQAIITRASYYLDLLGAWKEQQAALTLGD